MIRRILCALGVVVLLLGGISASAIAKELVILHTNDTHSNLFPFGPHDHYGGIARMSTMIKKLRSENENLLAVHAGRRDVLMRRVLLSPEYPIAVRQLIKSVAEMMPGVKTLRWNFVLY